MLPESERTKSSRKVMKFLLEVQHCKSSNMEFEFGNQGAMLICGFLTQSFNNVPDVEFYRNL